MVDGDGVPVRGAQILVSTSLLETTEGSTSADGRFEIRGLDLGPHTLVAREGDRASSVVIRGVVVDVGGAPIAGATVDASADGPAYAASEDSHAITDSAGRWTIGPLSAASYQLQADWPVAGNEYAYFSHEKITAHAGDRDVRIVLPAAGTIRTYTLVIAGFASCLPAARSEGRWSTHRASRSPAPPSRSRRGERRGR